MRAGRCGSNINFVCLRPVSTEGGPQHGRVAAAHGDRDQRFDDTTPRRAQGCAKPVELARALRRNLQIQPHSPRSIPLNTCAPSSGALFVGLCARAATAPLLRFGVVAHGGPCWVIANHIDMLARERRRSSPNRAFQARAANNVGLRLFYSEEVALLRLYYHFGPVGIRRKHIRWIRLKPGDIVTQ